MLYDEREVEAKLSGFKVAMADAIMAWCRLEGAVRYLLETMAKARGIEGQILTSRIGNVEMGDALRALSFQHDETLRDHVTHFLKGFEAIRSWRNYLAHAIQRVALEGGTGVGYAQEIRVSRKHGLQLHQQTISTERVTALVATTNEYHLYLTRIISHAYEQQGLPVLAYQPLGPDTMPVTPDDLGRDWVSSHNITPIPGG